MLRLLHNHPMRCSCILLIMSASLPCHHTLPTHPCPRNGDVAWEALVSTDMLAALGWQYNPATGLLERTAQYANPADQQQPQEGAGAGMGGTSAPVTPAGSTAGTPRRGGVTAAAPAGVMEAGASPGTPFSSAGAKAGGFGSSNGYGASKAVVGESGAQLEGAAATSPAGGGDKTDMVRRWGFTCVQLVARVYAMHGVCSLRLVCLRKLPAAAPLHQPP